MTHIYTYRRVPPPSSPRDMLFLHMSQCKLVHIRSDTDV